MEKNEAKNILIVGAQGSGKSLLMGQILSQTTRDITLISTYRDQALLRAFRPTRMYRLISPMSQVELERLRDRNRSIREFLIVEDLLDNEIRAALAVIAAAFINRTLAIDEGYSFLSASVVSPEVLRLYRGARHIGVETITATQRLVDISPGVRASFSDLVLFNVSSYRDLDILSSELPERGLVDEIRSLPLLDYVYIGKHSGDIIRGKIVI